MFGCILQLSANRSARAGFEWRRGRAASKRFEDETFLSMVRA
jgi:hypothetical protein